MIHESSIIIFMNVWRSIFWLIRLNLDDPNCCLIVPNLTCSTRKVKGAVLRSNLKNSKSKQSTTLVIHNIKFWTFTNVYERSWTFGRSLSFIIVHFHSLSFIFVHFIHYHSLSFMSHEWKWMILIIYGHYHSWVMNENEWY
jgi:hypothetical protein